MNKTVIIIIVAVVGYYLYTKYKKSQTQQSSSGNLQSNAVGLPTTKSLYNPMIEGKTTLQNQVNLNPIDTAAYSKAVIETKNSVVETVKPTVDRLLATANSLAKYGLSSSFRF